MCADLMGWHHVHSTHSLGPFPASSPSKIACLAKLSLPLTMLLFLLGFLCPPHSTLSNPLSLLLFTPFPLFPHTHSSFPVSLTYTSALPLCLQFFLPLGTPTNTPFHTFAYSFQGLLCRGKLSGRRLRPAPGSSLAPLDPAVTLLSAPCLAHPWCLPRGLASANQSPSI